MTQDEFDKSPLLDQILYDTTGMLVENHKDIAEAMEKYHESKVKKLGLFSVSESMQNKITKELNPIVKLMEVVSNNEYSWMKRGLGDCEKSINKISSINKYFR